MSVADESKCLDWASRATIRVFGNEAKWLDAQKVDGAIVERIEYQGLMSAFSHRRGMHHPCHASSKTW